ncbi:MAG: VWA domain-containing protein [Gammaproteobacteria bacterium]|nr:VWA domain-containing protein [Gammaproteobacteria bacterium]
MNYRVRRCLICALCAWAWVVANAGLARAQAVDTRVLIDISGSMKRTDPNNMRAAALRLVTDLLPSGSQAGVWTFGRYVNMEVPHGVVDDVWRARAERGASRIHSRGMFTNIEDALRRATRDWQGASSGSRRNLLLLTDGMVDVSKEPGANQASRARLLQLLLPDLKARDIKIMTVALSAEADHELLRMLARETAGWYELASDAGQLQRAFLHAFEKTADTDAVPLHDNGFQVDASIKELTLLVFRAEQASPTLLQSPDGTEYSANTPPPGARWRSDEGYDLITVEQPQAGHWQVDAQLDPDNRVLVATDLRLQTGELGNHRLPSDGVEISASLQEAGRRIERADFMQLVQVFAEHTRPDGSVNSYRLQPNAAQEFTATIGDLRDEGVHSIVISASSDTFARERQVRFNVALPVTLDLGTAEQDYPVRIAARTEFIGAEQLQVQASLQGVPGQLRPLDLVRDEDGIWYGRIGELPAREHTLSLRITGTSPSGQPVDFDLPPVVIEQAPALPPEPVIPPQPPPRPRFDWIEYAWPLAAANVAALFLVSALWWWRKRRDSDPGLRLGELES